MGYEHEKLYLLLLYGVYAGVVCRAGASLSFASGIGVGSAGGCPSDPTDTAPAGSAVVTLLCCGDAVGVC